jgi:lipopolysaccharide transport system permease protein
MQHVIHSGSGVPIASLFNPLRAVRNLWSHRNLMIQMAARDIAGRYRSSLLGMFWAVITPLLLLTIYTFVFSVVLKARWGQGTSEPAGDFAITMFCGMLVFNLFAESVNRAPGLIVSNPNLVKKVVFPLEVLVPSTLLAAGFTLLVGVGVWLIGWFFVTRSAPSPTILWLPIVLLPVCLLTLGLSWILASLGVFARDMGHIVALVTQMLFFTTPVFFRLDTMKEPFRTLISLNPLTHVVEDARQVMMGEYYWKLLGQPDGPTHPTWETWGVNVLASGAIAMLGYAFFVKSKRAFSDVI